MLLPRIRMTIFAGLMATFAVAFALAGCMPPAVETAPEPEVATQQKASSEPHRKHSRHHKGHSGSKQAVEADRPKEAVKIPEKVVKVLKHIDEHHRAPEGYVGGRVFRNLGRDGEQALPRTDEAGKAITYHEWDVNPKKPGVNRGAERLVTGSDGKAYFTADHYRTFKKVR